jgi:hypothetical protein
MKTTLNYLGILLVGIIIGIVCSIAVRSKLTTPIRKVITDTTTVIKYDTIRITEPYADVEIPLTIKVYPIAQVPTLLAIVDTMKIPYIVNGELIVPISQKYYRSPQYQAWVSGYNPKLDSIVVYNTHTLSTIKENRANNAIYVDARLNYYTLPAMSLELQAGYTHNRTTYYIGAGAITDGTFRVYGMVGIKYTLFTKNW